MKVSVLESKDYDRFELLSFNRDVRKITDLEISMRQHGFIPAYPLHVVMNGNGKFKIKAGHHRFYVAQKLGIPVKYVVCNDTASIYQLEKATVPWKLADYLASWIRNGKKEYQTIKDYHEYTGINLGACISMLAGDSASSGNQERKFKQGTYKLGNPCHAGMVSEIVMHIKKLGIEWASTDLLVQAISKVCWADSFDLSILKKKLSSHTHLLQKQSSKKDYVLLLDTIYNYQSRNPIPLAFLADRASRERNAIKVKTI